MTADVIELRQQPNDRRPKKEQAYEAAIAAIRGVVAARDTAVRALEDLAESFVGSDETVEGTLALSLEEALDMHHSTTIGLWQLIRFVQTEDLDGDHFENLTKLDVPELEEAWTQWKRSNWPEEGDDG